MAENRKYYFLKLKEDFFEQDTIVLLESLKDGILYSNILMKMYLKSLQFNGFLKVNEHLSLTTEMIATLTRHEVSFLGEERVVGCLCRCAAEGLEKERARHDEEENLMRIRQMKSAGLQDKTFYNYTFERCDASQENAIYARRYAEHFEEMAQTGQGLLFLYRKFLLAEKS